MKCVFVSGKHEFTVQYLSPAVVEIGAKGLVTQGSLGVEQFSLYEGRPVQFRTGQTAVFLPTELSAQSRRELFEAFCEVNPRLVEPSHGG